MGGGCSTDSSVLTPATGTEEEDDDDETFKIKNGEEGDLRVVEFRVLGKLKGKLDDGLFEEREEEVAVVVVSAVGKI